MKVRTQRWVWVLALCVCVLLVLKSLVCGIYRVDTASMEPTIQGSRPGGERVLVVYSRARPERFDLVVVQRPGEAAPLVKRVGALPGERVQIVEGDLLVDGKRLPPEAPRPRPIPVFDERWQDPQAAFPIPAAERARWTRAQGEWSLAAGPASLLEFYGDVKDSYLDSAHALVAGEIPVNDLVLELELWQEQPGTRASLMLSEAGDRFELQLELAQDGTLTAALVRRGADRAGVAETLLLRRLERGAPGWHRVRFSNIDDALCFERDGVRLLQFPYAGNRYAPGDTRKEGRHLLPRAGFGGADGGLRFRGVQLARDLYYTQRGAFGVGEGSNLGPDGYFLLGDNSSFSRDGREWGETRAEEFVGRPVRVVWPLSSWRALEGAVPPPPLVR